MYEILDISDPNWNIYLKRFSLSKQDIYYTSEYYHLCAMNGDGKGNLFYLEDKLGNKGFYPFLVNKIRNVSLDKEYFDIETAYGYGGPIIECSDESFYEIFEDEFIKYCRQDNIIAEFVRFHPLIKNEGKFNKNVSICKNRTTISVNLSQEINDIWSKDLKSENRTRIRKAQKNGLCIEISRDYQQFKKIYELTMNKVGADENYYFSNEYFLNIANMTNAFLINVMKQNRIIASGCFLRHGDYFHYHLGGSLIEYLGLGPNNLMIWEGIKFGKEIGCKVLHLGGGLTDEPNDNLFRFKKSFSKDSNSFFIGKRIHNKAIYETLIAEWEEKKERKASLFLQYRL